MGKRKRERGERKADKWREREMGKKEGERGERETETERGRERERQRERLGQRQRMRRKREMRGREEEERKAKQSGGGSALIFPLFCNITVSEAVASLFCYLKDSPHPLSCLTSAWTPGTLSKGAGAA